MNFEDCGWPILVSCQIASSLIDLFHNLRFVQLVCIQWPSKLIDFFPWQQLLFGLAKVVSFL